MHLQSLLFSALPALAVLQAEKPAPLTDLPAHPAADADTGGENLSQPARIIIEVGKDVDLKSFSEKLTAEHGVDVQKIYDSDIFRGLSVQPDNSNVDSVQAIPEVIQAWNSETYSLASALPGAERLARVFANGGLANREIHEDSSVAKAHEAGFLGRGAVVAIIDTGVDYTHPALGGGFGPGFKVAGGYDFVGDGRWPNGNQPKVPDEDPMDYHGHGTAVAGIIAGKTDNFTGVAPEASIYIFKVFTASASTDDETVIEALLAAADSGADIISISISGVNGGFGTGALESISSRLVEERGVFISIAAGNDGEYGVLSPATKGSGKNAVSVGSTEPGAVPVTPFSLEFTSANGETEQQASGYWAAGVNRPGNVAIVPLTLDKTVGDDTCNFLPENLPDLSDSIVLIRAGGCDLDRKMSVLYWLGNITNFVIYNDVPSWTYVPVVPLVMTTFVIDAKTGEAIVDAVNAGGSVRGNFVDTPQFQGKLPYVYGGSPSLYTSFGPTYDLDNKPDISAPGNLVLTTSPGDSWIIGSGTSMAAPYVAGVAALWAGKYGGLKIHGRNFGLTVRKRIISSGTPRPWRVLASELPSTDLYAPVQQVGTGLIDAWKVVAFTTTLSFEKFNLNDTGRFSRYHNVEITNNAAEPVTYTFSLVPYSAFDSHAPERDQTAPIKVRDELTPKSIVPGFSGPSGTFKVKGGETKRADFVFKLPENVDGNGWPFYGGIVVISGSNGESLSIPYSGAAFDTKKQIARYMFAEAPIFSTQWTQLIQNKPKVSFKTGPDDFDFLRAYFYLRWGTTDLRWDIFDKDYTEREWKYPPVPNQAKFIGSATTWQDCDKYYSVPVGVNTENTIPFPVQQSRIGLFYQIPISYCWLGKLANGSYIVPGKYKMRVAALVPYGTRTHSDNWDVLLHNFEVVPQ